MLNNEAQAATVFAVSSMAARTATLNGSWVDISEYEGDILVILGIGTVSGTTPTLDVKIQDADDNSGTNAADLPGALFGTQTAGPNVRQLAFRCNAARKWVRAVQTIGGTTPSFMTAVYFAGRKKTV